MLRTGLRPFSKGRIIQRQSPARAAEMSPLVSARPLGIRSGSLRKSKFQGADSEPTDTPNPLDFAAAVNSRSRVEGSSQEVQVHSTIAATKFCLSNVPASEDERRAHMECCRAMAPAAVLEVQGQLVFRRVYETKFAHRAIAYDGPPLKYTRAPHLPFSALRAPGQPLDAHQIVDIFTVLVSSGTLHSKQPSPPSPLVHTRHQTHNPSQLVPYFERTGSAVLHRRYRPRSNPFRRRKKERNEIERRAISWLHLARKARKTLETSPHARSFIESQHRRPGNLVAKVASLHSLPLSQKGLADLRDAYRFLTSSTCSAAPERKVKVSDKRLKELEVHGVRAATRVSKYRGHSKLRNDITDTLVSPEDGDLVHQDSKKVSRPYFGFQSQIPDSIATRFRKRFSDLVQKDENGAAAAPFSNTTPRPSSPANPLQSVESSPLLATVEVLPTGQIPVRTSVSQLNTQSGPQYSGTLTAKAVFCPPEADLGNGLLDVSVDDYPLPLPAPKSSSFTPRQVAVAKNVLARQESSKSSLTLVRMSSRSVEYPTPKPPPSIEMNASSDGVRTGSRTVVPSTTIFDNFDDQWDDVAHHGATWKKQNSHVCLASPETVTTVHRTRLMPSGITSLIFPEQSRPSFSETDGLRRRVVSDRGREGLVDSKMDLTAEEREKIGYDEARDCQSVSVPASEPQTLWKRLVNSWTVWLV
ncbi:hypothetical protein M427DRAFT_38935 [Gonapodya prolifera JEL478]|uniref:Uncharacterized protein n=1 Tax=Gonapodya prolifera (strain JEL478) TaxID=1344416 RepID=A0A138ZY25_GONPJ|nr:hypothetical protein M427DRAFT_38935 [Gonapodya prolifera JEL478]|eukprot:KXS09397.1 hypothetical protein M427DRAFT_38935 [Gonapodya prolifera JEL478]